MSDVRSQLRALTRRVDDLKIKMARFEEHYDDHLKKSTEFQEAVERLMDKFGPKRDELLSRPVDDEDPEAVKARLDELEVANCCCSLQHLCALLPFPCLQSCLCFISFYSPRCGTLLCSLQHLCALLPFPCLQSCPCFVSSGWFSRMWDTSVANLIPPCTSSIVRNLTFPCVFFCITQKLYQEMQDHRPLLTSATLTGEWLIRNAKKSSGR